MATASEATDISEIRFRYRICGGVLSWGAPTGDAGGRSGTDCTASWPPVDGALYAPQVTQWLREDPDLSGAEILRRVRLAGYRGGKSALYELVRRLRVQRPVNRASSS